MSLPVELESIIEYLISEAYVVAGHVSQLSCLGDALGVFREKRYRMKPDKDFSCRNYIYQHKTEQSESFYKSMSKELIFFQLIPAAADVVTFLVDFYGDDVDGFWGNLLG